MNNDLITIGKITKNQGNKGEVKILSLTDFPERFDYLDYAILVKGKDKLEKQIESVRFHKGFVVIKFSGIDNIGQALELKDYLVKISADEALTLEEDEYYIDDLIGFSVVTITGEELGNLLEVISTGGTDIFLVKGQKKKYMIPAAREIITEVSEEKQSITINPIPGLLDL